MTIEIEEVTVKDGIVRITALNCSEENLQKLERLRDDCYQKELQFVFDTRNNKSDCIYLTYWLHHQKVTAGCKTYGEAFYRIRGTVTTISGKYLEPAYAAGSFYFINYYSQRMKAQKGDHYDDRNERKNDLP